MLSLSTLLSFLLGSRIRSQSINEVNQQGFQVMHIMTQAIRNGRTIQVPVVGASSSTLSVAMGNPLISPTTFFVSSSTLMIREASNPQIPLTNSRVSVTGLTFQNVSSTSSIEKIIKMSFTLDYINNSGKSEYSYTKTFSGSATMH
jgi:hypothetical protein